MMCSHSGKENSNNSGTSVDVYVTSTFDRKTRVCHVCRTITSQSCSTQGGNWFRKANTSCETKTGDPTCEDITM